MTETKKCECCPTIIERGNLSSYNWKRLQFCKTCRMSWRRRNKTKYMRCRCCGKQKPIFRFKKSSGTKNRHCQPCKACDALKKRVTRPMNVEHLNKILTIPWKRAA